MNIIDVTFKILRENAQFATSDVDQVEQEAKKWEKDLLSMEVEKKNFIQIWYSKLRYNWIFSLGCAIAYIIISKRINAYKRDNTLNDLARTLREMDDQDESRGFF